METYNMASESCVIGSILKNPAMLDFVKAELSPDDFFSQANRGFYEIILELDTAGIPYDLFSVSDKTDNQDTLSILGGMISNTPNPDNAEHYAKAVKELASQRKIISVMNHSSELLKESDARGVQNIALTMMSAIDEILLNKKGLEVTFKEAMQTFIDESQERLENGGGMIGLPTSLPALDSTLMGLQPQRLVVLAARPSIGKTALANQIACLLYTSPSPRDS